MNISTQVSKLDLYNAGKRIAGAKSAFQKTCADCYKVMGRFELELNLLNYSDLRILKYWQHLHKIHKLLGVCFDKAQKEEIQKLVVEINKNPDWQEWSKADYKKMTKFFWRWLVGGKLKGSYPELVDWITVNVKPQGLTHEQVFVKKEVEMVADAADNVRDRALVLTLFDTGCRISEILNMKVKDIVPDQYGCVIYVNGKTGPREVRMLDYHVDLFKWLDALPDKSPDAYVWINQYGGKEMIMDFFNEFLLNRYEVTIPSS